MEKQKYSHPTFGMVSFSKVSSGGGIPFYGSDLKYNEFISLRIHGSYLERSLTSDYYVEEERIIEVRMTKPQFSELLTSMNSKGVPCTIEFIKDKTIPKLPKIKTRRGYVRSGFKERMDEFSETLKAQSKLAKEIIAKKTLSKLDQENLGRAIASLFTQIQDNIPYFLDCFDESMEEILTEVKSQITQSIEEKVEHNQIKEQIYQILVESNEP